MLVTKLQAADLMGVPGQHHGAQVDRFPDFVDSAALVGDERVAEEDVAGLLREALEPGRVEPGQVAAIPAELFVDLAGGTGDVAALLARKPGRRVVVVDPSIPMMREGGTRADAAAVRWIAGEAERLPFADGSVQALTVSFGLRNTTRLDVALAEAARVLAPGGTFACLEFSRPMKWLQLFYDPYSFHVIPRLGAWVAANPAAYQYLIESIRNFPDQQRFAAMIEAAGFSAVRWKNLSFGIAAIHLGTKPAAA